MPACIQCHRFDNQTNTCTVPIGSPGRKCVIASQELRLTEIRNSKICEIGPGTVTKAKDILEGNGNEWFGIEPQSHDYLGVPTIRTHEGTASKIPFPDESMDYVLANQSMEHWHEFDTPFRQGLSEIYRVLRPGGTAILNVPIHLHGHQIFLRGDLPKIKSLFSPKRWERVEFEEWRRAYQPLERWKGWPLNKTRDSEIPNIDTASTWILEMLLTKTTKPTKVSVFDELHPWWTDCKTKLYSRLQVKRMKDGFSRRFGVGR
jgi:SAM-dependent methyltransferase